MTKLGLMKKKGAPKKKRPKEPKIDVNQTATTKEARFDFGGLPEVNLKKNLGCG
ncbi:MAG: hypothetical protein BroJett042_04710 [Bacteroidota bacterium]|nr:MAG: hypothetical protein BroJett042_04710 [Bacteroidota bacterium]